MNKIDYCIYAVRHNYAKTHIEQVALYPLLTNNSLGASQICTVQQVLSALDSGKTFVTITRNGSGNWQFGQDVEPVKVNGVRYIRTNSNSRASDNLDNLPTF